MYISNSSGYSVIYFNIRVINLYIVYKHSYVYIYIYRMVKYITLYLLHLPTTIVVEIVDMYCAIYSTIYSIPFIYNTTYNEYIVL